MEGRSFHWSLPRRLMGCLIIIIIALLPYFGVGKSASSTESEDFVDYYTVLGINKHASLADVKKAYRKMSLEYHPDKTSSKGDAAAKFHRISEAYEVLSRLQTRRLYDLYGKEYKSMEGYFEELPNRGNRELYRYKRGVFLLFERNIEGLLAKSKYTWILTFAQPGCGTCERNVPLYTKLGEQTMNTENVRLAVVNCLISNLCHYFGISHLGQVFLLPPDQDGGGYWDKREYTGLLQAEDILEAALEVPASDIREVESDAAARTQLASISGIKRQESQKAVPAADAAWLVQYYKPSCMPCRQAKSELRKVSHQLRDRLVVSFVNCDKHSCAEVPYFPFARLFIKRHDQSIEQVPIDLRVSNEAGTAGAAATLAVTLLTHLLHLPRQPPPSRTRLAHSRSEEF
ncbi:hypothetical protein CSUI_002609 [Cystoisospora suis]|uniref:J domain-containing protein n=1 Tax=Cystoisospora suis TaxID=483139 RepID=A0A2C6L849_9APIC|nr:hypothetical protein CSUI_002609 [Cystoisospora suis]